MKAVDSAAITSRRMAGPTSISCHVCGWRGSCAALSSPPLNLRPFSTTLLPSRMAFGQDMAEQSRVGCVYKSLPVGTAAERKARYGGRAG